MPYVLPPAAPASLSVCGSDQRFAVHRIYCVGRNYAEHAREMGSTGREAPFFFMKPADAVVPVAAGQTGSVPYPSLTNNYHHELELVVAMGRGGADIAVDSALEHVWGYAVGLDMTRRDLQSEAKQKGRPWSIAKGFDASAPIGPLTPAAQAQGIARAGIALTVNGSERQKSTIADMIWSVPEIIAHLSRAWLLAPGDLIFTGTPAGVGAVVRGDLLAGHIDGLEPLRVKIA
ncbi:fumarylacetoacetate hydrolase family protein [Comamonas badia]|uniref:fumarylacetoacetate hydrolase family protein n=1 Tax=Comamonas badia TaxID=265291 RepID=UPI000410AC68|nr:fumarylacetoacetate hydrolase family protein [Comamonas badia]